MGTVNALPLFAKLITTRVNARFSWMIFSRGTSKWLILASLAPRQFVSFSHAGAASSLLPGESYLSPILKRFGGNEVKP